MQTNFTPEQLENPRIAEADAILRRCVHCGLCTATCPTYVLLGDERDSPRGRIYLIKDMLEDSAPASPEVQTHVDRCLSCLSCMTTCPSGVDYMHLVDLARGYIEETGTRTLQGALRARAAGARAAVSRALPPRAAGWPRSARPWVALAAPARPQGARRHDRAGARRAAAVAEVRGPRHRRDRGGAARARHPARGLRAAGAAPRASTMPPSGCSPGAASTSSSRPAPAAAARSPITWATRRRPIAFAKRNVDAWSKELAKGPVDAIIVNASGCGTMVKDYGHLLKRDPEYAARAARISEPGARHLRVRRPSTTSARPSAGRRCASPITPPARCSTARASTTSRARCSIKAGFGVVDVPKAHICCGSAGTYNILQPELAGAAARPQGRRTSSA